MSDRVLLIDDEEEFVETLAERLRVRGLRVETAHDGPSGLEKVENTSFDAILLDLAMPGMDGIETLQRIRQRSPISQVVLLTGQATVKQGVEAMRLGALDVLEKPVNIGELESKIAEAATLKMRLHDEQIASEMSDIVKKKGW